MLAPQRRERIVELVESQGSVSARALVSELDASPATIRRDIEALAEAGLVIKVHGGATALSGFVFEAADRGMDERYGLSVEEKKLIGIYAASLLQADDFIYIDAGSTTEALVDALDIAGLTVVTNSVVLARKLVGKGYRTFLTGGELKASTEALVGPEALAGIQRYHFTKGFFGTNGATRDQGFTTPDINEAQVKRMAMERSHERFVLADASKFGRIAPVTFSDFTAATLITAGEIEGTFGKLPNVVEVSQ